MAITEKVFLRKINKLSEELSSNLATIENIIESNQTIAASERVKLLIPYFQKNRKLEVKLTRLLETAKRELSNFDTL